MIVSTASLREHYTPKDLLKEVGWVKVFAQDFKNEARYYILFLPELDELKFLTHETFKEVHDRHWQIESFHRVIVTGL